MKKKTLYITHSVSKNCFVLSQKLKFVLLRRRKKWQSWISLFDSSENSTDTYMYNWRIFSSYPLSQIFTSNPLSQIKHNIVRGLFTITITNNEISPQSIKCIKISIFIRWLGLKTPYLKVQLYKWPPHPPSPQLLPVCNNFGFSIPPVRGCIIFEYVVIMQTDTETSNPNYLTTRSPCKLYM